MRYIERSVQKFKSFQKSLSSVNVREKKLTFDSGMVLELACGATAQASTGSLMLITPYGQYNVFSFQLRYTWHKWTDLSIGTARARFGLAKESQCAFYSFRRKYKMNKKGLE
jgi:hypothetical protein